MHLLGREELADEVPRDRCLGQLYVEALQHHGLQRAEREGAALVEPVLERRLDLRRDLGRSSTASCEILHASVVHEIRSRCAREAVVAGDGMPVPTGDVRLEDAEAFLGRVALESCLRGHPIEA